MLDGTPTLPPPAMAGQGLSDSSGPAVMRKVQKHTPRNVGISGSDWDPVVRLGAGAKPRRKGSFTGSY